MKRRLTQSEEFEILKLVIDKFLWLGFLIIVYGLYRVITDNPSILWQGFGIMIAGVAVLGILIYLLIKEYEILK